jgi:hypothetical protein
MKLYQCCGTGALTPGTVTFCLSGTGFGHGSNIKWNLGNNTASSNEKADFFVIEKLCQICKSEFKTGTGTKTSPK